MIRNWEISIQDMNRIDQLFRPVGGAMKIALPFHVEKSPKAGRDFLSRVLNGAVWLKRKSQAMICSLPCIPGGDCEAGMPSALFSTLDFPRATRPA